MSTSTRSEPTRYVTWYGLALFTPILVAVFTYLGVPILELTVFLKGLVLLDVLFVVLYTIGLIDGFMRNKVTRLHGWWFTLVPIVIAATSSRLCWKMGLLPCAVESLPKGLIVSYSIAAVLLLLFIVLFRWFRLKRRAREWRKSNAASQQGAPRRERLLPYAKEMLLTSSLTGTAWIFASLLVLLDDPYKAGIVSVFCAIVFFLVHTGSYALVIFFASEFYKEDRGWSWPGVWRWIFHWSMISSAVACLVPIGVVLYGTFYTVDPWALYMQGWLYPPVVVGLTAGVVTFIKLCIYAAFARGD